MARYTGSEEIIHQQVPCAGILLTNLGTPDAPTASAVRRYLAEFLSDPRVIEIPRPLWWLILHGIILRIRPEKSAKLYRKIWTREGSPLLNYVEKQARAVQDLLANRVTGPVKVEVGMRYGNPSLQTALENLKMANVQRLLVLPLYPQYSATTTASTFDAITGILQTWRWIPELRMVNHYHDEAGYIDLLAKSIHMHWQNHGQAEKLLFSFHGIPKHYFLAGDPYFCECQKTARLVAEKLGLSADQWLITFQSRFGPREWLQPYTDKTLQSLAESGTSSVNVICPGFSSDCLETLEEINIQNRALFLSCGGKNFTYIPALNDSAAHIEMLTDLLVRNMQGWPECNPERDRKIMDSEVEKRLLRVQEVKSANPE